MFMHASVWQILNYEAQRAQLNSWEKQQKPAINETKTIREIDWLYLCRQQFDKFWTGNGN